jgi:hypothetical protein
MDAHVDDGLSPQCASDSVCVPHRLFRIVRFASRQRSSLGENGILECLRARITLRRFARFVSDSVSKALARAFATKFFSHA